MNLVLKITDGETVSPEVVWCDKDPVVGDEVWIRDQGIEVKKRIWTYETQGFAVLVLLGNKLELSS